ncbi:MAG: FG-GAP repeat domain-containing protein [Candidatus Methanospirareceae archaeon]
MDWNNDGIPEVLVDRLMEGYYNEYRLSVLDGKSGEVTKELQLGIVSDGWGYTMLTEDLDGDGIRDVVAEIHDREKDATEVVAVRGKGWSTMWRQSFDGDVWVGYSISDLDGDELPDLVVIEAWYNETSGEYQYFIATLRGVDGTLLWHLYASYAYLSHSLYPAGDLNGDGLADLVLTQTTHRGTEIVAMRGYDGFELWSTPAWWSIMHPIGDINGDGADDIVIVDNYRVKALSGRDGSEIWSANGDLVAPFAGDLNGDGTYDVVFVEEQDILKALQLNNGSEVWQASFENPDPENLSLGLYVEWTEDFNGDSIKDVLLNSELYNHETYETKNTQLHALDGRDGSKLWSTSLDAYAYCLCLPGDLNGNGINDIIMKVTGEEKEILVAVEGANGNILWDLSFEHEIWSLPAGDLDGNGLNDVIVSYWCEYEKIIGMALRGYDGSKLWEVSDAMVGILPTTEYSTWWLYPPSLGLLKCGVDVDNNGVNDVIVYDDAAVYALSAVPPAPKPSISVKTDKTTYKNGDFIWLTTNFSTGDKNHIFRLWVTVPKYGFSVKLLDLKLPPHLNRELSLPIPVKNWGNEPFSLVFVGGLFNITNDEIKAWDATWCRYQPIGKERKEALEKIMKNIKSSCVFY